MITQDLFYNSPQNELEVRTNIILKYFNQWAKETILSIKNNDLEEKLAFIDLCAGRGLNEDNISISSKILQLAIADNDLRNMMASLINDKSEEQVAHLTGELIQIDLVETLHFRPQINLSAIDEKVVTALAAFKKLPAFLFLDLWNYEGLSIDRCKKLVKDNGADCLMVFDYAKIQAALSKKGKNKAEEKLIQVFGKKGYAALQEALKQRLSPFKKEQLILQYFEAQLKQKLGKKVPQPLRFKFFDTKGKTCHFLYFMTQNDLAYDLMREIFCSESQIIEDGIGNLEFNPQNGAQRIISSQTLFGSMFDLEQELLNTYKSQTLQMVDIYENHNWGRALVKKNYVDALLNLEQKNKITVTPKRHKRINFNGQPSLGDKVFVSFNKY